MDMQGCRRAKKYDDKSTAWIQHFIHARYAPCGDRRALLPRLLQSMMGVRATNPTTPACD
jgi:hypothetical protein